MDLAAFDHDPYPWLADLRATHPIAWIPAMGGWLITRRDLVVAMMRDAETFTVEDPRFSTAQVVGPSMLSLDGSEHERHRRPFVDPYRGSEVRSRLTDVVSAAARRLVAAMSARSEGEIRVDLAGPLAVEVVARSLGLAETEPAIVRSWYDDIVEAVTAVSTGETAQARRPDSVDRLGDHLMAAISQGPGPLGDAAEMLNRQEVVTNAAVVMFGAIETVEGAIAAAFVALLEDQQRWEEIRRNPELISRAIDESLRLTPSVMQVDRFATSDVVIEGVRMAEGDFVILSIAAANRDAAAYSDPDTFDMYRSNARTHLTFAHGPHACLGSHLARLEAVQAVKAALQLQDLRLTDEPTFGGLVFRKPRAVPVTWSGPVLDLP